MLTISSTVVKIEDITFCSRCGSFLEPFKYIDVDHLYTRKEQIYCLECQKYYGNDVYPSIPILLMFLYCSMCGGPIDEDANENPQYSILINSIIDNRRLLRLDWVVCEECFYRASFLEKISAS